MAKNIKTNEVVETEEVKNEATNNTAVAVQEEKSKKDFLKKFGEKHPKIAKAGKIAGLAGLLIGGGFIAGRVSSKRIVVTDLEDDQLKELDDILKDDQLKELDDILKDDQLKELDDILKDESLETEI